jgi:hypothetical protein
MKAARVLEGTSGLPDESGGMIDCDVIDETSGY